MVLGLALRVFFRRIEVAGLEHIPPQSAVIFVLNHPNGLVDPVFILCLAPRRVSFLAKAPLFRMPVIGYFVRALDSLPVYRKQDEGEDPSRNRETFELSRALLKRGGTIAICPEGVSHNEPRLKPLKTGAARIALSAASMGEKKLDVAVVPAGLYYTEKTTFRSAALLYFGEPIRVEAVELDTDGAPPREAVRALSKRIEQAMCEVILNAEHEEALATVDRAERIFSSEAHPDGDEPSLERELLLRRRFIEGYTWLRTRAPERLAALDARIRRYEEELKQVGVDMEDLAAPRSKRAVVAHLLTRSLLFLVLLPIALAGTILHYPAYRLAGYFARKFSQNSDDVVSTIKIIAALLLFPLTWIGLAIACYTLWGWPAALGTLILTPLAGFAAVRFFEEFDQFIGDARALLFFITRRWFFKRLLVERRAIHEEIVALANEAFKEAVSVPPSH